MKLMIALATVSGLILPAMFSMPKYLQQNIRLKYIQQKCSFPSNYIKELNLTLMNAGMIRAFWVYKS
jgi:hypothetical protein